MIHIIKNQKYECLFLPQDFILYMKDGIIVSLLFEPNHHDNTTYFSLYKGENGKARKEIGFELLVKDLFFIYENIGSITEDEVKAYLAFI